MKKSTWAILIVYALSLYIAFRWESLDSVRSAVGAVLDPTLGVLLNWNLWIGFIIIVALTSLILTLAQKYLTDQATLREIKKEQKILQDEMKKYKDHPEKLMEFQQKQLEFLPRTMHLTMRPLIYTGIPIILLFRWFGDFLRPTIGGWWILYYLIGALVFSSVFRRVLKVA